MSSPEPLLMLVILITCANHDQQHSYYHYKCDQRHQHQIYNGWCHHYHQHHHHFIQLVCLS